MYPTLRKKETEMSNVQAPKKYFKANYSYAQATAVHTRQNNSDQNSNQQLNKAQSLQTNNILELKIMKRL